MNPCEFSVPEGALNAFRMLDNVTENHFVLLILTFYQKPFKGGLHSDLFSTLLVQNCCLPWGRRLPWYGGLRSPYSDRLRTGRPGIAEFPTGSRVISPQNVQVCSGPHIAFCSVVPWGLSVWVKRHWCVAEVLFTSFVTASVRYASIYDHGVHFTRGEVWDWRSIETDCLNGALKIRQTLFPSKATLIIFALQMFLQRILNCQVLRVWIWCDLLFTTHQAHFSGLFALSQPVTVKEAYVDLVPNPYMLRPVPYFVAFYCLRLHTHRCSYVTRSHVGVSCGISSCSYVVCKIL